MKSFVGCSGWQYNHWKKRFYPEGIPKDGWLGFYSKEFPSVEVNGTFYGSVKKSTFARWYSETPYDFRFTLKGNRYITHMMKLKGVRDSVRRFYNATAPLKHKLACILWQLPPMLKKDLGRLEHFCAILDKRRNNVIEFRDKSWYSEDVFGLLRDQGVSFCVVSASDLPGNVRATTDILYVRFHGSGGWYIGSYRNEDLESWAKSILRSGSRYVYCYFNNDQRAYAVDNARTLSRMLCSGEG